MRFEPKNRAALLGMKHFLDTLLGLWLFAAEYRILQPDCGRSGGEEI